MGALENLGIDLYSLIIYTVNFGIIVFFVSKFFNGPIIKMLQKREDLIKNNLSEAENLKDELVKQQKMISSEKEQMRQQMADEIRRLNLELDKKRKIAESEIELKRNEMMDEIRELTRNQKRTIEDEIKSDIALMVKKMVLHIVSNKISEEKLEESVTEAWDIYQKPKNK